MKRLIILLMLLPSFVIAGGYVSGGGAGVSQTDVDKSISDIPYRQTWNLPITYSPNGFAYIGGYYDLASSAATFSGATTHGIADGSYAAHFMIVVGAVPGGEVLVQITGDKITDSTAVETAFVDTLTIPKDTPVDSYLETSTKWLGQISIIVVSGTPVSCNYGYSKYWDNGNRAFTITGGEATWMGDVNGATINLELIHHKATGWTYNAAAEPDPPTPVFSMADAHGTNVEVNSNIYGAFKRSGGSTEVAGNDSEGVLVRFTFSSAACLEYGQISLEFTQ